MIVEMARVRVMGPRAALRQTIAAVQDLGIVQVVDAACPAGLSRHDVDAAERRRRRHLARALADIELALEDLARLGAPVPDRAGKSPPEGHAARTAARAVEATSRLLASERALSDERDALRAYEPLFAELDQLIGAAGRVSAHLLLPRSAGAIDALRDGLARAFGDGHELRTHRLASGETVVLLLAPAARGPELERLLAGAHVEHAPLPAGLGDVPLADALPRMRPRLAEVTRELEAVHANAAAFARAHGEELVLARRGLHDALLALDAGDRAVESKHAFVLEGWLPARERRRLATALAHISPELSVEELARDELKAEDAPVVLSNPRLFSPFEALTSLLPLPKYGTVDPTPFVAVFFPMFFGVVVGDVGYGVLLAALAALLWLTSKRGGLARDVAKIAAAVSVYTVAFGFLYGELFGDLGTSLFGMRPLLFDRREALLAFLVLAIGLGAVHLILGLVVAAVSHWRRDKRTAIGRGLTALMLALVAVALLAVFELLPGKLLTPAVIALLVAFPIVVVLEGATALLDFMSIFGHVLSYARVMAIGVASVMLAVVANRMIGAFGSAAVGIAFALLFHLVNFAITLFTPTIHVMRLHYVEFFGTFFEPGGGSYQPLRHWQPEAAAT